MCQTKVVEKIKTHFLRSINFIPENRAVYEIKWKNTVQPGRPETTIWRMHIACWITKTTDTHSEYVIRSDFPLRQWLHGRDSMLRYTWVY